MLNSHSIRELPHFEYRKVRLKGVWDDAHSIYLGPLTRDGTQGYEVVTPLVRSDGGSTILVNRGFVATEFYQSKGPLFAQDLGEVEIIGFLRAQQHEHFLTSKNDTRSNKWNWPDVHALALNAGGADQGVQEVYVEAIFGKHYHSMPPIGATSNMPFARRRD